MSCSTPYFEEDGAVDGSQIYVSLITGQAVTISKPLMLVYFLGSAFKPLLKDARPIVRSFEEAKGWAPGTLDLKNDRSLDLSKFLRYFERFQSF